MDALLKDLSYSIRTLVRQPGFTAIAIITLALGIGGNTAIFSVINSVLLRPLPYPKPESIVQIWEKDRIDPGGHDAISMLNFFDWQSQNKSLESVAAYEYQNTSLTGVDLPVRLVGIGATHKFFDTIGVQPFTGRTFTAEEDKPGNNRVVILGYGLWQRMFGGNAGIVGQQINLDGEKYSVIGIMPQGFQFPAPGELWTPLAIDVNHESRGRHGKSAIGRLKSGVPLNQAQAEMTQIAQRLAAQYPDTNAESDVRLVRLSEELFGGIRPALLILLSAVGMVLLIACANIANLLLIRGSIRQKEIAIRIALGASRSRLVRQLLTESLLLSITGAAVGLLFASQMLALIIPINPGIVPKNGSISIDASVLVFTLGIALLTGIIFGLVPALQASKPDLNETLKIGGRGAGAGFTGQRLRSLLIVAETAIAIVLLIGSGLLIKSFWRLQHVDTGFQPDTAITMRLALPKSQYATQDRQAAFVRQITARLETLPGVESAGAVTDLPFSGSRSRGSFIIIGRDSGTRNLLADRRASSAGYFRAMGISLVKGRFFEDSNTWSAPRVAVINELMAKTYFPGEDPIGRQIAIDSSSPALTIVGIVGNIKHSSLESDLQSEYYLPFDQRPDSRVFLAVRSPGNLQSLIPEIRAAVKEIDSSLPVFDISPMSQRLSNSVRQQRFNTWLLGVFAALALALSALGTYGVMSYAVTQRTNEIGIRMALGADRYDVLRMVVGRGMKLTLTGVGIGLLASLWMTGLLSTMLFGVSSRDTSAFLVVPLFLIVVALLANYIPARRATRIDPMNALRYD